MATPVGTKDQSPSSAMHTRHGGIASGGGETRKTVHGGHGGPSAASNHLRTKEQDVASITSLESVKSGDNSEAEHKVDLSVSSKWKVTERLDEKLLASRRPTFLAPFIKWWWTIAVGILLLACLSVSKLSIVGLAKKLNNSTREAISVRTREGRIEATRIFLMIALILLVPYCFNFLRAVILSLFRKDMPWPSITSLITGIGVAVLESFGVCLFALKVLVKYKGYLIILLMNAVLVVPLLVNTIFYAIHRRRHRRGKEVCAMSAVGCVSQVAGFGLVLFLVLDQDNTNIWHVFLAIACLTVAWVPAIQQLTVKPKLETADSSSSGEVAYSRIGDTDTHLEGRGVQSAGTSWKMGIVSNFVKAVGVLVFSYILFYVDGNIYTTDMLLKKETYEEFLEAWQFVINSDCNYFITNIHATLVAYFLSLFACQTNIHKWAFAIPICLTCPLFVVVLLVKSSCLVVLPFSPGVCVDDYKNLWAVIVATACFCLAHLHCTLLLIFRSMSVPLQKESSIFWMPSYNGVLLEQWLILNRQTGPREHPRTTHRRSRVYICTTMFRETQDEMRQLLQSINQINLARGNNDRFFESHIMFDSGIRKKNITEFPLQLLTLIQETLGILTNNCKKTETPYGMKLSWDLPQSSPHVRPMTFNIHLKDERKVRNKKRWSQIMYMSYVIDFLVTSIDEDCFILTTDGDVAFTPDSVEALLHLMTRDPNVGAVCARTHPIGSGPLVWYQVFEYAIGHWFQKTAEHVLGSVLCAPGSFSVYRCVALQEVLTVYSTSVEHAFDFLTKDMGEDRWLCTLLIQSGWRIEYCAASKNSTHCPSDFEEFYKQRRRWIASTIANLLLMIKQWKIIRLFSYRVSPLFIAYQIALLVSTLIAPSTVILIISGGLSFAWDVSPAVSGPLQLSVAASFTFICLFTSEKTQLLSAKLLTFIFAIVMAVVIMGAAVNIADELNKHDEPGFQVSTDNLQAFGNGSATQSPPVEAFLSTVSGSSTKVSPTTIYVWTIFSVFVFAAVIHPREFLCLIYGICYLLCLPSGYLLLMIYSICNIPDKSWGTREAKNYGDVMGEPGYKRLQKIMEIICFCCIKRGASTDKALKIEVPPFEKWASSEDLKPGASSEQQSGADDDDQDEHLSIPVEEWLPTELKDYSTLFRQYGYGTTLFISGMTEKELYNIGVKDKGTRQDLLQMIEILPAFEIEYRVPNSVIEWLETVGLTEYEQNFKRNGIKKATDLCKLKSYGRQEVEKELRITMAGHIKRLLYAIQKLREPSKAEERAAKMKALVDRSQKQLLKHANIAEYDFWRQLIDECLKPTSKTFGIEAELKGRLGELRNSLLMVLAVSNSLWLILIITLAAKTQFKIFGANSIGLSILLIFGTLLGIQFLAMIIHRISTLVHFVARAPFKCGKPMATSWSFQSQLTSHDPEFQDDMETTRAITDDESTQQDAERRHIDSSSGSISATAPLLSSSTQRELKTPPF
ncbi:chitin synthase chs-2-like [Haliotis asinina]|uniref:chitin synthase chs-2-like n=1 Tax=Haliotis asinina TaxID=109174 RepID=UPI003532497F